MRIARGVVWAWVCVATAGVGSAQSDGTALATNSSASSVQVSGIVERMQERNAERQRQLSSYTGERTYQLEYHGTGGEHHAAMVVEVQYGDGGKQMRVVSESGSKLICDKVLKKMVQTEQEASDRANRMQVSLSEENYRFEMSGEERVDGVDAWILRVTPKVDNKLTYRGRVWVAKDDLAVVRVVGEPAKNPSWWINRASFEWRYARHGRFWLPERTEAVSHVRIGGEAKLVIEYGPYQMAGGSRSQGETVALRQPSAGR